MRNVTTRVIKYFPVILGVLFFVSCKNEVKNKTYTNDAKVTVQKEQTYAIDNSGVSVGWTAYKFTERTGVKGIFEVFSLASQEDSESIESLLKNCEINISTQSVNSGDKTRDGKLQAYFFKVFHTDTIRGNIISAANDKGTLNLKMNGIKNEVDYTYSFNKDMSALSTTLDLTKWKGAEAIKSLNEECNILHTGFDGVSKLWPDVTVEIKLPMKSVSQKSTIEDP